MTKRKLMDRLKRDTLIALATLNSLGGVAKPMMQDNTLSPKNRTELMTSTTTHNAHAKSLLNTPITDETRKYSDEMASVGSVLGDIIYRADGETKDQKLKNVNKSSFEKISHVTEKRVVTASDMNTGNNIVYTKNDTVYVSVFEMSEALKNEHIEFLEKSTDMDFVTEKYARLNNPLYMMALYNHEVSHAQNYIKNLHMTKEDPGSYMKVERDWTSEKIGHFAFTASLANSYLHLKELGVESIQYNNLEMPIEKCLDGVRGLGKIVNEEGFDINKPECILKLAQCSSADWNETYKNAYTQSQFKRFAENSFATADIMDQIQIARDQNTRLDRMCDDIPIGYNMRVDLPQEARNLMFASSKDISEIVDSIDNDGMSFSLSKDGLLAIDNYMSQKGLKTDKDKAEYLKTEFSKIVNRDQGADKTLEALFLNAGKDKTVHYTDNTSLTYQASEDKQVDMSQAEVFINKDGKDISLGKITITQDNQQKSTTRTFDMGAYLLSQRALNR